MFNLKNIFPNEPRFRQKQIQAELFKNLVSSWQEAKTLPLALRQKLESNLPFFTLVKTTTAPGTTKALFKLTDNLLIEAVLLQHIDARNTVCVSSQVGCPMNCSFCATGQLGFKRNLTAWEICQQVLFFSRQLKKDKKRVSNLVFMGMGEPFLNYDAVLATIKILNSKTGLGIGCRHISISTCGIVPGINKLAQEKLAVNLAISLHAPSSKLRSQLMPVNKQYPLEKVFQAVNEYIQKTNRQVMFEYLLLKGINDSCKDAQQLANLMKKPLYFVNLILYNPTGQFRSADFSQVKKFKDVLTQKQIKFSQRYRFGSQIKAACGQLAADPRL